MSVEEILKLENRNKENLCIIHFFLEGTFWRAYEWSAFLCRNFPSGLSDDERLKPIKKINKINEDGYIQVGLQLASFEKYFPGVVDNSEIFTIEDKHILINAESFFTGEDFTHHEEILRKWKQNVRLSSKKNKQKQKSFDDIDLVVDEIVSHQIDNKTMIENVSFLSYIKDKIINIKKSTR